MANLHGLLLSPVAGPRESFDRPNSEGLGLLQVDYRGVSVQCEVGSVHARLNA